MSNRQLFTLFYTFLTHALAAPSIGRDLTRIQESKTTLPITTRINTLAGTVLNKDQAHIKSLLKRTRRGKGGSDELSQIDEGDSVAVTNRAVYYTANVGIGSPPRTYTLALDTGSSINWVKSDESFQEAPGTCYELTYNKNGAVFGYLDYDTFTITSDLVARNQIFLQVKNATILPEVDGLLGLGPIDLAYIPTYTGLCIEPGPLTGPYPTLMDNLFSQKKIEKELFSLFFSPTITTESENGEITFGGIDSSKITQDVQYFPISSTSRASEFWGIDLNMTYGDSGTTIVSSGSGIVDSGTTLFSLAPDAFDAYISATGADYDNVTGLVSISPENYINLQSLLFRIGDSTFEFTADAQTWPLTLNSELGGIPGKIYLAVQVIDAGYDFILGYVVLERFYSVYDTTNNRVGLATTLYTNAMANRELVEKLVLDKLILEILV